MDKVQNIILVDYENIQDIYLGRLDDTFKVIFFIGAQQNTKKLEKQIAKYNNDSRVEYVKVSGVGKNSLDFYIAFTIGRLYETTRFNIVYILSADRGFDPLVTYIRGLGKTCIRIHDTEEVLNLKRPELINKADDGYGDEY
jgi:hypothetical protein